jgi:hypothetical protein
MGVLLAWALGYVVGAKGGAQDFDDVVQAVKELRDSDEARQLWSVLRSHLGNVLRSAANMLEEVAGPQPAGDLVDRVRLMMKKA